MPAYGAAGSVVTALYSGDSALAFNAEQPATGVASIPFALYRSRNDVPPSLSVEVFFAAAPGAFEFDVQEADTETANAYVTNASATLTAVNAGFYGRIELPQVFAKFVRILCKTQNANAVNATVKVSR